MCTLSYLPEGSPRWIFFNRDELDRRARADAPTLFRTAPASYLMPLDRESGGSWMGLHSAGFFICLLNNYPGDRNMHSPECRSRGLLIRDLLNAGVFPDTDMLQAALVQDSYAPLYLAAFSWNRTGLWEWNSQSLRELPTAAGAGILTSSSHQHERITTLRMLRFRALPQYNRRQLKGFHRRRGGSHSEEGILMSRADARTVSISEICLKAGSGSIRYYGSRPFLFAGKNTLNFTAQEAHLTGKKSGDGRFGGGI